MSSCFATALNLYGRICFVDGFDTIIFPFSARTSILCLVLFSRFSPSGDDENDTLDVDGCLFSRFFSVFFVGDDDSDSDVEFASVFVLTLSMCLSVFADLFIAFRFK